MRKRTLRYNEFVNEFLNIDGKIVREFEETAKPAENLGTPTEVKPDTTNVDAAAPATPEPVTEPVVEEPATPVEEPTEPETEEPAKTEDEAPLDLGGREDVSIEQVTVKKNFIDNYIKGLADMINSMDKLPLDEKTKEDISNIFAVFQNLSNTEIPTDNEAIKLYFNSINLQLKDISTFIANADKVPLDKTSKERIVKIYNIIRNIKE